ncbi:hypothetical protein [Lentilactobacillus parakefiri]|uniref:hypothetical protein n=1 Tax=Lentilactobacillus parakefiri TaxID=152332 RepID=UPI001054179F|nr:hypothetical protein [Lentilactobacillus parakefiri]
MKLGNEVLLGVTILSIGTTTLSVKPTTASANDIPTRLHHKWVGHRWGQIYRLNAYRYHCNFFDGAWHHLYYSHTGYNKWSAQPAGHSYNGLIIKYLSPRHIRILYDLSYINLYG